MLGSSLNGWISLGSAEPQYIQTAAFVNFIYPATSLHLFYFFILISRKGTEGTCFGHNFISQFHYGHNLQQPFCEAAEEKEVLIKKQEMYLLILHLCNIVTKLSTFLRNCKLLQFSLKLLMVFYMYK